MWLAGWLIRGERGALAGLASTQNSYGIATATGGSGAGIIGSR